MRQITLRQGISMELQQLNDFNVASKRQSAVESPGGSQSLKTQNTGNNGSFEDQLNRQIDQSKTAVSQENTENNQIDSEAELAAAPLDSETAEGTETQVDGVISNTAELEEADSADGLSNLFSGAIPEPSTADETLPDVAESAETNGVLLPPVGMQLPSSVETTQSVKTHTTTQTGLDLAQSATKAALQPGIAETITAQGKEVSSINVSADEADIRMFNLNNLSDRLNMQKAQLNSAQSEMPATEVITQTTRMQQVPLTTSLNSSMNPAHNMNVSSSAVMPDASFTLNTANSLSSNLTTAITANLQSPEWSRQMTDQVSFMVKGGFQQADIKLNPAHLGPMEIKLSIKDDQASVSFVSQHAVVRDVIDAAMPRLRDMLEQQGINLADVDVSAQSEQQQSNDEALSQQGTEEHADINAQQAESANSEALLNQTISLASGVSIYA